MKRKKTKMTTILNSGKLVWIYPSMVKDENGKNHFCNAEHVFADFESEGVPAMKMTLEIIKKTRR